MLKKLLIIFTAFVLVMAAGCAPGASKQSTAETLVCQNLVLLKNSIDNLNDASKNTDSNAMQASLSVVRRNLNNVVQSAANLTTVKLDNLQNATNDLGNAVSALPPDTAVPDALNSVQPQLKTMAVALEQLNTDLDCANLLKLQSP